MSQKDRRDGSQGHTSTKLNNLYLHFLRGDSQRENIPTKYTFETFLQSFWDLCSKTFCISQSILSVFRRHFWELPNIIFGIRSLTSVFWIFNEVLSSHPFRQQVAATKYKGTNERASYGLPYWIRKLVHILPHTTSLRVLRTGVVSQRLVLQVVHMEQLVAETCRCDLSPSVSRP